MVTVRLFASVAQLVGAKRTEVDARTVGEALERLAERYGPGWREQIAHCRVLLNDEAADPGDLLGPDDELAILPPVAGGGGLAGQRWQDVHQNDVRPPILDARSSRPQ